MQEFAMRFQKLGAPEIAEAIQADIVWRSITKLPLVQLGVSVPTIVATEYFASVTAGLKRANKS